MKFKFDSRTGMMMPEKDENIYFAKAMSGGLANYRKFMKGLHESIVKNFNDFVEDK